MSSTPRTAARSVTVEDSTVELAPLGAGADPRAECDSFCVWFEPAAGEDGARMVLYSRRDGTSRDRIVSFVHDPADLRAIREGLGKILIISRSVFGEALFEPGTVELEAPVVEKAVAMAERTAS